MSVVSASLGISNTLEGHSNVNLPYFPAMGTQLQTVNKPQTSSAADKMDGAMKAPLPFSKPPPPPDKPR